MNEKKLTDEEIIHNLKYFGEEKLHRKEALDLINRLKEGRKTFFRIAKQRNEEKRELQKKIEEQQAEIERLKEEIERQKDAKFQAVLDKYELRKINAELQKQVGELTKELERVKKWIDFAVRQAVKDTEKDTAKEICDLILEHWEKKQFVECDWLRVAISEKYGVEVE